MANEATITVSVSASKGGQSVNSVGSTGAAAVTWDMAGADMATVPQVIGSGSDEALAIPADLTPVGAILIKNLDAAISVDISTATGGSFAGATFQTLIAGAVCLLFPSSGVTYYAKAASSSVSITFTALEGALS
jgi:hypothetical protein